MKYFIVVDDEGCQCI